MELALPGGALPVEVVHLVAEPVEALHHLGLVDHAGGVRRPASAPTARPRRRRGPARGRGRGANEVNVSMRTSLNQTTDMHRRHAARCGDPSAQSALDDHQQLAPRSLPDSLGAGRRVGRQRPARLRLLRAGHPGPRRRCRRPRSRCCGRGGGSRAPRSRSRCSTGSPAPSPRTTGSGRFAGCWAAGHPRRGRAGGRRRTRVVAGARPRCSAATTPAFPLLVVAVTLGSGADRRRPRHAQRPAQVRRGRAPASSPRTPCAASPPLVLCAAGVDDPVAYGVVPGRRLPRGRWSGPRRCRFGARTGRRRTRARRWRSSAGVGLGQLLAPGRADRRAGPARGGRRGAGRGHGAVRRAGAVPGAVHAGAWGWWRR